MDAHDHPLAGLDEVDRAIVNLVVAGASNKAIAREVGLAEGTVKWRLHRLYGRLGVQSRVQFAMEVHRVGWPPA